MISNASLASQSQFDMHPISEVHAFTQSPARYRLCVQECAGTTSRL